MLTFLSLIAVCGLGGHAFKSFSSSETPEENWLRDYLPQYLPGIRVLVYGYDTRIVEDSTSKKSINDIATSFFNAVTAHLRPSVGTSITQITERITDTD